MLPMNRCSEKSVRITSCTAGVRNDRVIAHNKRNDHMINVRDLH